MSKYTNHYGLPYNYFIFFLMNLMNRIKLKRMWNNFKQDILEQQQQPQFSWFNKNNVFIPLIIPIGYLLHNIS
ncbi:hypothetical protein DERF_006129 [Dermatophagoides farinae]|uniref:Uncharacterized protein n=1 Tax=Dermatophagoides farinae TaxID=6954 RepID=A0A922LBX1_DERFA|nr:hypothetical protein DERF_006129 [Dermatophagoides farinae]